MIPVSNISTRVDCSSNGGDSRWIGQRSLVSHGPFSSTGRPITESTRPSVSRPTGTVIGPPVSSAFIPRTIPSVACIAMQRTRFSPRCWATSSTTSRGPISLLSRTTTALWIEGRCPSGNSTSTAGPMI